MKFLRSATVCAAVSLVALTAGFAQRVQTDFDHRRISANTSPTRGRKSSQARLCGIRG